MGNNNSSRQYTYKQYYIAAINKNKLYDFSKINFDLLNPYEVLDVSNNFTWNELKDAYKQIALLTHPDKETGNKIVFNFVTDCFKILAQEYKSRKPNKTFIELKKQFKEEINEDIKPAPITGDNFNEKFNKTFEMFRLDDEENDFGYGDTMIDSSNIREDFSQSNLFEKKNFDNNSFNQIFNKHIPPPPKTEIIKYKDPEPLVLAKTMNYTEIGGKKPDDYSSSVEKSSKNNLIYSDYKIAYSNTRLVDDETLSNSIKNFKTLEEYERYRNLKFKKGLTDKEKKYFEEKKLKEEKEEYLRLERIKQNDNKIRINNENASKLFIK